jgi:hypothetical protein
MDGIRPAYAVLAPEIRTQPSGDERSPVGRHSDTSRRKRLTSTLRLVIKNVIIHVHYARFLIALHSKTPTKAHTSPYS